jgi:hypothetical protein
MSRDYHARDRHSFELLPIPQVVVSLISYVSSSFQFPRFGEQPLVSQGRTLKPHNLQSYRLLRIYPGLLLVSDFKHTEGFISDRAVAFQNTIPLRKFACRLYVAYQFWYLLFVLPIST